MHKVSRGKDWLGADVLLSHEEVTRTGLNSDEYDLECIADEGDACIAGDIDLCQDAQRELTTRELAACAGLAQ